MRRTRRNYCLVFWVLFGTLFAINKVQTYKHKKKENASFKKSGLNKNMSEKSNVPQAQQVYQQYHHALRLLKEDYEKKYPVKFVETIKVAESNSEIKLSCVEVKCPENAQESFVVIRLSGYFNQSLDSCKSAILDISKLQQIDENLQSIEILEAVQPELNYRKIIMKSPVLFFLDDLQVYSVQCVAEELHPKTSGVSGMSSSTSSMSVVSSSTDKPEVQRVVCLYSCSDLFPRDLIVKSERANLSQSKNCCVIRDRISCLQLHAHKTDSMRTKFIHFSVLQLSTTFRFWLSSIDIARKARDKFILAIQYFAQEQQKQEPKKSKHKEHKRS